METRRIPLFPLNVVLFPGMTLPLHIFEPRYQVMIRHCRQSDNLFGVCLIRSGEEVGGPADPYRVGTTCEILSVTPLEDGRLRLVTAGRQRFRVLRLFADEPYLEAEVELLPGAPPGDLGDLPERVREAARRYINALLRLAGHPGSVGSLPDEPEVLADLVAAVLQVPLEVRQELLETGETAARLRRELVILEEEVVKLPETPSGGVSRFRPVRPDPRRFSLN